MATSLRIDTAELLTGALLIGDVGHGVLGSSVPSTGQHGPAYAYNDLALPADAGKEIRGSIEIWPLAGTLFAFEDTSFTFSGPDGQYTFTYRLFVDGVDQGTAVVTLNLGASGVLSGGLNLDPAIAAGTITITDPTPPQFGPVVAAVVVTPVVARITEVHAVPPTTIEPN